jgi:3-dehydroquinate dehydratase-1
MIRLGNLELGLLPRIAVALSDLELRVHGERVRGLADVFELRIDRFERHDPSYVRSVCEAARGHGVPLLATARSADEGGEAALADGVRLPIFEAVMPVVDGIDIEIHAAIRDWVVGLARRHGKLVIASHHDFEGTPPDATLVRLIDEAKRAGADVAKIAVTVPDLAVLDRLLGLLRAERDKGLILIGMGGAGVASRVFFPLLGSLLTYAFADHAVAPGQLSLSELTAELRRYSPEFARDWDRRQSR